ncbi:hypothetical protein [Xanthobacter autotrophicus]|uniref:hypothetical protein n=1 Tax=Xanthobacter autotrophicus TaxID=280 RepID=UPI0024A76154|nr:hypothetical protein [Xanthobacter autotrophicus]MDI4656572.1 hypothetical protein [Xanthobacter autotrophicus]
MKTISGQNLIKRLVMLRGKFLYASERSGDFRLHGALNAFEQEVMALHQREIDFASMDEGNRALDLWSEVHALALKAFYAVGGSRRVYGLGVEPPPPPLPQFGPPPTLTGWPAPTFSPA